MYQQYSMAGRMNRRQERRTFKESALKARQWCTFSRAVLSSTQPSISLRPAQMALVRTAAPLHSMGYWKSSARTQPFVSRCLLKKHVFKYLTFAVSWSMACRSFVVTTRTSSRYRARWPSVVLNGATFLSGWVTAALIWNRSMLMTTFGKTCCLVWLHSSIPRLFPTWRQRADLFPNKKGYPLGTGSSRTFSGLTSASHASTAETTALRAW